LAAMLRAVAAIAAAPTHGEPAMRGRLSTA
jgi:hypothetical protein